MGISANRERNRKITESIYNIAGDSSFYSKAAI